jgi:phage anti-repressor protein
MLDMKLTKNNLTKKLGIKDNEVIELITTYQKQLPILSENGEGFCVNARDLSTTLCIKDTFSTWINNNLNALDMKKDVDYSVWFKQDATLFDEKEIEIMSSQKRSSYGISVEYNLTMDCAKQISMVIGVLPRVNQQTKELSKIARKYFIVIEKILKDAIKWELVRKPEKEMYKIMCEELKKYFLRNFNKEPMFYDYSNEADALNMICLGAKAKKIREYIDAQDNNTRDWLEIKYNTYLDKLQDLNTMYLKMNFDKERRYDLIKQGFKVLYPDASFLLICGDK